MHVLRILSGSKAGQCRAISSAPVTVGNDPANTLQIEDDGVSGAHAKIEETAEGPLLTDLGSTNGTYVNGAPIATALLQPGDVINFAGIEATLEQPASAPLSPATPVTAAPPVARPVPAAQPSPPAPPPPRPLPPPPPPPPAPPPPPTHQLYQS